jgi:uracil-DNA glycosylase
MTVTLRSALARILDGWAGDLDPSWADAIGGVDLDFDAIDPALVLEDWEPVFPARRGRRFPGAPPGAHVLRAFDGLAPADVRCVLLGQDPYPEPGFCTGRAFEAGNVARWSELDKMFSTSVRAFMQMIVAARTGDPSFARSFGDWRATLQTLESDKTTFEAPGAIADRWVAGGALPLNSALTLSRFAVAVDPHQAGGHLPLWRPLILEVLRHLAARGTPLVVIGFGDVAGRRIREAGIPPLGDGPVGALGLAHPADAATALAAPNPFVACNGHLVAHGAAPVRW